jgi:hypothetical protein
VILKEEIRLIRLYLKDVSARQITTIIKLKLTPNNKSISGRTIKKTIVYISMLIIFLTQILKDKVMPKKQMSALKSK